MRWPNSWVEHDGNGDKRRCETKLIVMTHAVDDFTSNGFGLGGSPSSREGKLGAMTKSLSTRLLRSKAAVLASGVAMFLASLPTAVQAAPTCLGVAATIVGTDGDDTLTGTSGDDVIVGLGGSDLLVGRAGNDRICGGPGRDFLYGDAGRTQTSCPSARGSDRLSGGRGNDALRGESCYRHRIRDWFFGGPGSDEMLTEGGRDVIDLGSGEDTLFVQANDPMTVDLERGLVKGGGLERDTIVRGTVENVEMLFTCYRGDLTLIGDDRANRLVGSGGDDVLRGRGGRDMIRADGATPVDPCPDPQGNDHVFGGAGRDRLSAGRAAIG
ncbi:hypothetical protein BH20ACT23_BH20ACT23_31060 [soil metagenome]